MNNLAELRERCGFKTIKLFCMELQKQGFTIDCRRYGRIERGASLANSYEIKAICTTLQISADLLLFGGFGGVNMRCLTEAERELVASVARQLIALRQ